MLTVERIARLVSTQRWSALLEELLRNGRPLPLVARARLCESGTQALAAMGLGLQRAVELAYVPCDSLLMLADRLASCLIGVSAGGAGGGGGRDVPAASPAALAMGVRAIADLLDAARERSWAMPSGSLAGRLNDALSHATQKLHAMQSHGAQHARDRGLVGDTLDSALVLWQLAGRTGAAARVDPPIDLAALDRALDKRGAWRDRDCATVIELAHAADGAGWAQRAVRAA